MNKHFSLKIIKILLIVGLLGIFSVDVWLIIVQPEFWLENVSEVTAPFIFLFLTPVLVLYFCLKDYFLSVYENKRLNFKKTSFKGIIVSFVVGIIGGLILIPSCSGEACLGVVFGPVLALVGGSIFSLILSAAFYFKTKN